MIHTGCQGTAGHRALVQTEKEWRELKSCCEMKFLYVVAYDGQWLVSHGWILCDCGAAA